MSITKKTARMAAALMTAGFAGLIPLAQAGEASSRMAKVQVPQSLGGDVTCDGEADRVSARVIKDHPDAPAFEVLVLTSQEGRLVAEGVQFDFAPLDGSLPTGQFDLCTLPWQPLPEISLEEYSQREAENVTGIKGICSLAITVDDGLCDKIRLFWIPAGKAGRRIVLIRN